MLRKVRGKRECYGRLGEKGNATEGQGEGECYFSESKCRYGPKYYRRLELVIEYR